MIKRSGTKASTALVTFELPAVVAAVTACVCGEFNDWSSEALPMTRTTDGRFEATVVLTAGRRWRFRYLLDATRWENDWAADEYVANEFGGEDSVVDLAALQTPPPDEPGEPPRRTGAPGDEEAAVDAIKATAKKAAKKAPTHKGATRKAATATTETPAKDLAQKATAEKATAKKATAKQATTKRPAAKKATTKKAATPHEAPAETAASSETGEE